MYRVIHVENWITLYILNIFIISNKGSLIIIVEVLSLPTLQVIIYVLIPAKKHFSFLARFIINPHTRYKHVIETLSSLSLLRFLSPKLPVKWISSLTNLTLKIPKFLKET